MFWAVEVGREEEGWIWGWEWDWVQGWERERLRKNKFDEVDGLSCRCC